MQGGGEHKIPFYIALCDKINVFRERLDLINKRYGNQGITLP